MIDAVPVDWELPTAHFRPQDCMLGPLPDDLFPIIRAWFFHNILLNQKFYEETSMMATKIALLQNCALIELLERFNIDDRSTRLGIGSQGVFIREDADFYDFDDSNIGHA
jgi:hypothetical protein